MYLCVRNSVFTGTQVFTRQYMLICPKKKRKKRNVQLVMVWLRVPEENRGTE